MTKTQVYCCKYTHFINILQDPGAFFSYSKPERPYPDKGWYLDRYATNTNQHLLRGQPMTYPYCWIDTQWKRGPAEEYNTARLGGAERWGPDKVGKYECNTINMAAPCETVSSDIWGQRMPRSACVCTQSDQGTHCPLTYHWILQNMLRESKGPDGTLRVRRMICMCSFCVCLKTRFRLTWRNQFVFATLCTLTTLGHVLRGTGTLSWWR